MLFRCGRNFLIYTLSAISLYTVEFMPQSSQSGLTYRIRESLLRAVVLRAGWMKQEVRQIPIA